MELRARKLRSESQVALPVVYHGLRLDVGYRIDMIVEDTRRRRNQGRRIPGADPSRPGADLSQTEAVSRGAAPELHCTCAQGRYREDRECIIGTNPRALGMRPLFCLLRFASVYSVPPFVNSVTSVLRSDSNQKRRPLHRGRLLHQPLHRPGQPPRPVGVADDGGRVDAIAPAEDVRQRDQRRSPSRRETAPTSSASRIRSRERLSARHRRRGRPGAPRPPGARRGRRRPTSRPSPRCRACR